MKIAISAVETSGDLIGASVVSALKAQDNNIHIQGLVGNKMLEAGCVQLWNTKRVNVMGFSEVLKKLPALLKLRKTIITHFSTNKPDVFIGVDGPDFNFVIERELKQQGVKTLHLISPSVWAWRESRVKKIKQSSDLVLCLFPFEVDFYQKYNQRAVFVGHPLAQCLQPRDSYQKTNNILLMPGSRKSEITRLLPELLIAAKIMAQQNSNFNFHLALADDELLGWARSLVIDAGLNIDISTGDAHQCASVSDLALVASGTATLELALIGVPMVVVYKLSKFSYFIAAKMVKTPYVSLPNIIANQQLVPELIQKQANGKNISQHAMSILNSDTTALTQAFKKIHSQLDLNASEESARIIRKFINE